MKKIPIGVSDFKKLIEENFFFVDKSLLIKEIIEDGAEVILFTRPRRFGKTLNMSMLKYFFAKTEQNNDRLFHQLQICQEPHIMKKQGTYPVIFITLKDEKHRQFAHFKKSFALLMSEIYKQHLYLLESTQLLPSEKTYIQQIINKETDEIELQKSLFLLSSYLYKYHQQKVIILIDEYDVPIQEAYIYGYYDEMIYFMRNFFSAGLKDNVYLEKAVLTGVLRIAKESVFSGLNNLETYSILKSKYSQYFGFVETEVEQLLAYYGLEQKMDDIRTWYNGYTFGTHVIYNPWSILHFVKDPRAGFRTYWVNTAENGLLRTLFAKANTTIKKELEQLIKGETIIQPIDEMIVMPEVEQTETNIWNFLLFTGYLRAARQEIDGSLRVHLQIPNIEVLTLFKQIILSWFQVRTADTFSLLLKSLTTGDIESFEDALSDLIEQTISYFDVGEESEKFYHALVLGMLVSLEKEYTIKSNRESGYGRYDIMLIPKQPTKYGIVIEFKSVNKRKKETLEKAALAAVQQIRAKQYKKELTSLGIANILEIGIAFDGKKVCVKKG
ncbi:MAG: ATP-binding protein [Anoxybacillus sp.]|nr:AAA family ATPase [Anoxybacillus sp.]MCL6586111.1 ATP-binding protein [Anoxybacillus sp.]